MATNSQLEMRWVDAWNDLFDIVKGRKGINCLLPDGMIVDVEECQSWLQESAYQGYFVRVKAGLVEGKPGVIVTRWSDKDAITPQSKRRRR